MTRQRASQWREVRRAAVTTVAASAVFAGAFGLCTNRAFGPPPRTTVAVYAENACDESRFVVLRYDDSTTWAAGGIEDLGFEVAARSRAGPERIGTPSQRGLLLLDVYRSSSPEDEETPLTREDYTEDLPMTTVDGESAVWIQVPRSACVN